jgi:hypothetical protein
MQQRILLPIVLLVFVLSSHTFGQVSPISRLELKRGEVYQVGPENILIVDTLILHDKATIRFAPDSKGLLGARIAFVGKDCTITARGADGENGQRNIAGANGENGGSIELDMHFMTLGSLVIDTRGGNGGNGHIGKHGTKPYTSTTSTVVTDASGKTQTIQRTDQIGTGSNGELGSPGGSGGNGGDLILTYSTDNFVPNFNHTPRSGEELKSRVIQVLYTAGKHGKMGRDGNSYLGTKEMGTTVIQGRPASTTFPPKKDGQIKIINANTN